MLFLLEFVGEPPRPSVSRPLGFGNVAVRSPSSGGRSLVCRLGRRPGFRHLRAFVKSEGKSRASVDEGVGGVMSGVVRGGNSEVRKKMLASGRRRLFNRCKGRGQLIESLVEERRPRERGGERANGDEGERTSGVEGETKVSARAVSRERSRW